jgi:Lipopolysaccharide-assembly
MQNLLAGSVVSGFHFPDVRFTFQRLISNCKFEMSHFKSFPLYVCVLVSILLSSCGYHVGGMGTRLPPGLKVIAVPTFVNQTNQYRIEQRMTEAVVHEFLVRTKYRIVSTESSADAVLHGEITSFEVTPAVFNTAPTSTSTTNTTLTTPTAQATTMLITVQMKVRLEDRETKKVLYQNDNYLFREPYEISTNPSTFFDERSPALERMSRDLASRLVADILENF